MAIEQLREDRNGQVLYNAGLPHFKSNFARDGILSAILLNDADFIREQLLYCAAMQGTKNDPHTGEEPGKIFHEFPDAMLRGLSSIRNAVDYILRHLRDGLFIESPHFCGASQFALKVTYWKDSSLIGRPDEEPKFPVVFPLAHFQNLKALRDAAVLLDSAELRERADEMRQAIDRLVDEETGAFYLAIDEDGPVPGISSDLLHGLYYLEVDDITPLRVTRLLHAAALLETPAGYRTLSAADALLTTNTYHSATVWPFEQAFIHLGAVKFGLPYVADVALRVVPYLDSDPEILCLSEGGFQKGGCDPQLWTIAAKTYFRRVRHPDG
jgi:glycogen debranching enzyme